MDDKSGIDINEVQTGNIRDDIDGEGAGTPPKRVGPSKWIGIGIALLAVIFIAVFSTSDSDPELTAIESAWNECSDLPEAKMVGIVPGDQGTSLSISVSEYDGYLAALCVLFRLDMPDAVMTRMDNTRALDGTQEASWSVYSAWWTYHPDSGLNMVVEDTTASRRG